MTLSNSTHKSGHIIIISTLSIEQYHSLCVQRVGNRTSVVLRDLLAAPQKVSSSYTRVVQSSSQEEHPKNLVNVLLASYDKHIPRHILP